MKTLLILRHAKSSWKDPWLADHDRPLNRRGKRDAPRMGTLIADEGLIPDLILSSTAKRAHSTAQAVADSSGFAGEIRLSRDFYHADPETFIALLRGLPETDDIVMIVGHNPGLEELLEVLTGDSPRLPTAALVQVALPVQTWRDLNEEIRGDLVNLWQPRELG